MNPTPEVYGAPETWLYSKFSSGDTSQQAQELKFDAPKIANFGGTDDNLVGSLGRAVSNSRLTENEPIDFTICPCGQDQGVSAYGKLAILNEDGEISLTPRIVERNQPINWCFGDLITDTLKVPESFTVYKYYSYSFNRGMRFDQWAPSAVNTGGYNNNYYFSPYTFWNLRSILLSIEVQCITNETATAISTTWRTLDDWKNNHSTEYICGLRCLNRAVNSYSSDTLTYINSTLSEYRYSGKAAILDPIPDIENNGVLADTSFYIFLSAGDRGRYTYIFKDIQDIFASSRIGILPAWNMFDNQTLNKAGSDQQGFTYYYKIPYSEENYEIAMKMVACFGCYFTPSAKYQFDYAMTDPDLCLPIIDDEGIAHGEYTRGSGNTDNDLYDKDIRSKDYDPSKQYDPNTYSNETGFNTVSSNAALTYRYVLDAANVEKLGDDLYTICDTLSAGDYDNFDGKIKDEFLTQSPIDAIISLQRFPFEIPHTGSSKGAVQLGKTQGQAQGYRTFFAFNTILFDGKDIFPRFGNCFLDYEPYTSYELYIPFCGTTKIRAADIIGHTLNVRMQIDLITGSCTAYIMADSLVIETASGSCGIDQPLSGIDSATINSNILQGLATQDALAQQKVNQFGAMAWPTGVVKSVLNPFGMKQSFDTIEAQETQNELALTHIEAPSHKMTAASPLLSWYQEFNARLIIYFPEGDVIASSIPPSLKKAEINSFGRLKGFATFTPGIVSQYSGFTRGDIRADGIPCTASERNRIKSMFSAGVYL